MKYLKMMSETLGSTTFYLALLTKGKINNKNQEEGSKQIVPNCSRYFS